MSRARLKLRLTLHKLGRNVGRPAVLVPLAFFGGGALISIGVALIALSAGLIVAGVALIVGACLYELNSADDDEVER